MALDIKALELTDNEIEAIIEVWGYSQVYQRASADAQFAKLAWGLREQIEDLRRTRHLHFDVMVVEKYIEEALEAAGIERPTPP